MRFTPLEQVFTIAILMLERIREKLPQIVDLCRRFDVKKLELFGSAARDDFDPSRSDIDLFVDFADYNSPSIADQWFGFQEEMSELLGAEVDLTSVHTAVNPYFLEVANKHRVPLYAA